MFVLRLGTNDCLAKVIKKARLYSLDRSSAHIVWVCVRACALTHVELLCQPRYDGWMCSKSFIEVSFSIFKWLLWRLAGLKLLFVTPKTISLSENNFSLHKYTAHRNTNTEKAFANKFIFGVLKTYWIQRLLTLCELILYLEISAEVEQPI